jgi:hypothetical protein
VGHAGGSHSGSQQRYPQQQQPVQQGYYAPPANNPQCPPGNTCYPQQPAPPCPPGYACVLNGG